MPTATKPRKRGEMIDLIPDALYLVQQLQTRDVESQDHIADIAATLARGGRLKHRVKVVRLIADEHPDGFRDPLKAGTNLVCDGFHTVRATRKANTETGKNRKVPCDVIEGTYRDAVLLAAGSNEHPDAPLKRSRDDKRRAVEMYFSVLPRASGRAAADHCHVSPPFASEVKKELAGPAAPEEGDGADDGEEEAGNVAAPEAGANGKPAGKKKGGKAAPVLVDWVDLEGLYGKMRRGFAHVAEVHGDLVDKGDKNDVEKLMNAAFDLVFGKDMLPASWKDRILKQKRG